MPQAKIEDLTPHPQMNIVPRMSKSELEGLVEDIRESGIQDPILITTDNHIIDGHNRFEAAKQLELKKVPVEKRKMTEGEIINYMLRSATFRRQLKDDQRMLLMVEYLDHVGRKRDDKGKFSKTDKTQKEKEQEYGFPRHKVDRARTLYNKIRKAKTKVEKDRCAELLGKVRNGTCSINKAHNVWKNVKSAPKIRKGKSWVPQNLLLGITLETNISRDYNKISKAPRPGTRCRDFIQFIETVGRKDVRTMVTIEPVLKFDLDKLVNMVKKIDPVLIWLGYESKGGKLPEPTQDEFRELHWALSQGGFPVTLKQAYPGKKKKEEKSMYAASVNQVSPFVGCEHGCKYCETSFQKQAKRRGCKDCYAFKPHYDHFEERLVPTKMKSTRYGEFNWLCQMGDIAFCDDEHFWKIIDFIEDNSDRMFLLQTKDPKKAFMRRLPAAKRKK